MKYKPKGLTGLIGERKGVALAALLILAFVVAAFADTVLLSIDYTAPNATILSIDETSDYAFVSTDGQNFTIWYNNASSGNFTVTANAQDNVSGIVNMTWNDTVSLGGTNATGNISDINFTWYYEWSESDTTDYTDNYVTVYDNASNSNTSWNFFNVLLDNVAPTTTDDWPANNVTWYNETSLTINLTTDSDAGGSGVNFTAWCLYNVSDGPCSSYTINYTEPVPINLTCNDNCYYFIRYFSGDQVGNNETNKTSGKINFAIGSYVDPGVAADENTTIESGSTIYDSGTNLTNATITGNSTIENSTVIDSALNGTDVNDSSVSNSTVSNSTVENSTVTDSIVNESDVNNSAVDNSTVFNSTIENDSNVSDSTVNSSVVDNSTVADGSIVDNSDITDSTTSNSTITYSIVENLSTVTDSTVANNSVIDNSTVANNSIASNSTIEDSTSSNSTITDSNVNASTVNDSVVANGSTIDNSTVTDSSSISNSTVEDSVADNSTLTDSTVNESSTVIDSTVANNSVVENSNMTGSTADNSTFTNSTMQNSSASDTTKIRSNNINTTVDLSTETDTNATDSNLVGANLTLCSLLNSVATNTNGSTCELTDTVAANSNLANVTADNCTIDNTDVSNSNCSDSIFNYTRGNGWNVDPSNITGSYCAGGCNVSNSNVTWSNISLSAFYNSNFNSSRINLSSANWSSAYDSDFYNSTLVNISVTNSDINDSSLLSSGTSFISISTIRLVTLSSNYTIVNSTLTNVTLYGSGTIQDSNITNSVLNDTSVYRSTITGMTAGNTTINDSTISNPTFDLNDSIINLANINDGLLVYGSITYQGTTYYGSTSLASIYAPGGPSVSNVQCANETGTFGSCSDIGYGETLSRISATATPGDYTISNVVARWTNVDDANKTLFYSGWVEQNATTYIFYVNQVVSDSGVHNISITATDSQSVTATNSTAWSLAFGILGAVQNPNADVNVTSSQVFTVNATFTCTVGECGDLNATLYYNSSLFSTTATKTPSDAVCLGDMISGGSCAVSWTVTTTGGKGNVSEFFAQGLPVSYPANVFDANSTTVNVTIVNSAPPTPSIVSPVSGSSVSSLTVDFDWSNSTDIDDDNVNYTFQIANNSGYSPLENETNITDSNFTYTVPSAGTWYWLVRAYDAENQSANATAFVIVSLGGGGNVTDTTPPLVVLNSPTNNAYVQSGNVTFVYTPSEQLSLIANCSLYINDALNQTNTTDVVNNAENNFTASFTGEASYNWTIECTDTSTVGPNSGNATPRVLNVDVALPSVSSLNITYPSGQAEVKSGQSIIVDVNASDSGSGVVSVTANCSSLNAGLVAATLQSGNSLSGTWRATCLASGPTGFEGNVTIGATATDAVGYSVSNDTLVAVDNVAPDNPAYLDVTDWPADINGIVNLSWPASASLDVASYNIYRSNVADFTPVSGLLIGSTNITTFSDVPPSDGWWYWRVTAVDNLGQENLTGAPENYTLVDTGAPAISDLTLTYPTFAPLSVTQTRVKDGDVLNIRVDATDPQNVSSVWVDVTDITTLGNETMVSIGGDTYEYNATISGASGNQTIRIYANDTSGNVRNGVYATVAIDNSIPTLDVQDDGNFTATTTSIHASWSYTDADSSALGYSYTIYNNLGETIVNLTTTTSTDVTKSVSPPLSEGLTYFWAVDAYDGAGNEVSNTTAPGGITVDTMPPVFLFVNDDGDNQSNTTALNASWSAQDLESGIRRYLYRIGEDNNSNGIIDAYFVYNVTSGVWKKGLSGNNTSAWANVDGNTSVTATIDTMNAYRYYIELKAENWAGVAALSRSNGIAITTISGCPLALGVAGTYTLSSNLSIAGGTCVTIDADDVTLDCQSYTIDGNDTGSTYGINNPGFDDVTVKNCVITNFDSAVYYTTGADSGTIRNNTLTSNVRGVYLSGSSTGNIVANNSIVSNTVSGVLILASSDNNITENNLSANSRGVQLTSSSSTGNRFANNIVDSSAEYGIYLTGSANDNSFANNTVSLNTEGIRLISSSDNNTFTDNTIIDSVSVDVNLSGSAGNVFINTNVTNANTSSYVSFTAENITLVATKGALPADPTADIRNLTHYVDLTNLTAASWAYLNVSYTNAELTTANVSEATVRIWKYNTTVTNWTNETFYAAGQWGVNAAANYAFANITDFASTFAPFGRPNTAPSQVTLYAPADAASTQDTTPTFEWDNATDAEGDVLTYELQVDNDVGFGSLDVNATNVTEASPRTSYTATALAVGTYYWRVRAYDGALYGNWSDTRNLAITSPPSGGGGGGGGLIVVAESQMISSIAANACGSATYIRFGEHGVQAIQVCVRSVAANVTVQITQRGATSALPPGVAYKYMDVSKTGLVDENVANVTFAFAVPNSWFAQNSVDYRHVKLYRFQAGAWNELETVWLRSDGAYHYYRAVSPGLSVFAISGPQAACPPECQVPGLWATCSNGQTSRTEYFCSADTGFSCEPKIVTKSCAPELLCPACPEPSDWSACAEGVQTRTEYVCTADTGYQCASTPVARTCEVPAACSACPEPSTWSACTNGVQSRSAYRCGPETSYACIRVDETASCLPPEALLVTAAAIVLILGLGMVVTVRRRAISRWARKVGKAKLVVPKITMPKAKPRRPEKIVKAAPPAPALPTVRPKVLRMPGKPKYVCSVCGKPELLVHWCEECGKETCLEHIHKVGTKLMCDACMKKRGLL